MSTINAILLRDLFIAGADALDAKKEYINELNVFPVPDGDTGTNMTMTIMSAKREVLAVTDITMENVCKAISTGSLRGARGNSGVILSQILRGFTRSIKNVEELTVVDIADAFVKAVETAYKAVMKPKEGTILTVAKSGAYIAAYLADNDVDVVTYAECIIEYMREVLNKTPEMLPVLKEAGVVDSGGEGLLVFLEGVVACMKEKVGKSDNAKKPDMSGFDREGFAGDINSKPSKAEKKAQEKKSQEKKRPEKNTAEKISEGIGRIINKVSKSEISTSDIRFRYCTEFIVLLETEFDANREAEFKIFLEAIGDSIVVVADDDIVKVHVHTNMPGIAIQKGLTYGSLTSMKIDNMQEEHNERLALDEAASAGTGEKVKAESTTAVEENKETVAQQEMESAADDVQSPAVDTAGTEVTDNETVDNATVESESQEEKVAEVKEAETEEPETEASQVEETGISEAAEVEAAELEESFADNMNLVQPDYTDTTDSDIEENSYDGFESRPPRKKVGFIAVSAGQGLSEIFAGLGADIVIEGGQTMNPSTEDMLNAIDKIDADNIFIFPNNSNIILASQQAASLIEDKNIIVIPSKTIPQGIMALLNYMSNRSIEDNESVMIEEMGIVKSGSVTYSVRNTSINGIDIKQGDIMGIAESKIVNVGAQVMSTTVELVDNLIDDSSELVSLYYGADTTEDEANLIADAIGRKHPEVDVEVHYGGQPVYYYYLSVE